MRPRLLQHKDAAKYCGISAAQLQKWVNQGLIVPQKFSDGQSARKFYELAELDAIIDANKPEAKRDGAKAAEATAQRILRG